MFGTFAALWVCAALATSVRDAKAASLGAFCTALGVTESALLVILAERAAGSADRAVAIRFGTHCVEHGREIESTTQTATGTAAAIVVVHLLHVAIDDEAETHGRNAADRFAFVRVAKW